LEYTSVYTYNEANQRTSATAIDGIYWEYTYDDLGQVISGKRYWSDGTLVIGQHFEYGFDDIGNRTNNAWGGANKECILGTGRWLNRDPVDEQGGIIYMSLQIMLLIFLLI